MCVTLAKTEMAQKVFLRPSLLPLVIQCYVLQAAAYVLPTSAAIHSTPKLNRQLEPLPRWRPVHLAAPTQAADEAVVHAQDIAPDDAPLRVLEAGCPSCEAAWLATSKQNEEEETDRLATLRATNMSNFMNDVWEYTSRPNRLSYLRLALLCALMTGCRCFRRLVGTQCA